VLQFLLTRSVERPLVISLVSVAGVPCDHLAFRNAEVDRQMGACAQAIDDGSTFNLPRLAGIADAKFGFCRNF